MAKPISVITLVDSIIQKAVTCNASDIHLEPAINKLRVRYRIDGVLFDQEEIKKEIAHQVCSRLKVIANINIAERRIPQDGKFRVTINDSEIDFRVSTFPSWYGEKVVIRILNRSSQIIALKALGFNTKMLDEISQKLSCSSGFFLVSGPTGSGKTTTLYAALSRLNSSEKNIITLEDPVEYNIEGITQGQINPSIGFTFEKGMRSLLRQDPDIVMVGEIRDRQTAQIAVEAALTGHVVLSTVHTNSAPGVVMRLMDMNIEPFLINAALTGVLAQRLARKICSSCKQEKKPTQQDKKLLEKFNLSVSQLFYGTGCKECFGLGYKGRVGIFELLHMTDALRSLIVTQPIFEHIYKQAQRDGMQTLLQDGVKKVESGDITLQELVRAVS